MVDQPWVHAAPSCGFTCNTNYNWNGISCVAATQTANCTSTPPPNATASTPTTFTQTWNGSTWLPVPTGWTHGASTCGFNCNTNYNWNGSTTCNPATDTFACTVTSLPPNAVPSSTMYTRTWNGTIFAPATMNYGYAATNCGFTCATNYNWNSGTSTCDAASNTFNCAAKPDAERRFSCLWFSSIGNWRSNSSKNKLEILCDAFMGCFSNFAQGNFIAKCSSSKKRLRSASYLCM